MLSYRHYFHAGNAADVFKHIILIYCLEYMTKKEKALLCIDTHAGAGAYRLTQDRAENKEWKNGIGKLRAYVDSRESVEKFPAPVVRYLELIQTFDGMYPGSPLLMGKFLRKQDRLVCFELHPRDFEELQDSLNRTQDQACAGKVPSIEIRKEDGPLSLKSLLPPRSRRGLIFVDPAWEEKDEYQVIPQTAAKALKRFPQGCYIIWYPLLIKPKVPLVTLRETLFQLCHGKRCRLELYHSQGEIEANSPRGMYGSGLIIYNPPWTLRPVLEEVLPFLSGVIGSGAWDLEWKE